jgi:hypothetical protein
MIYPVRGTLVEFTTKVCFVLLCFTSKTAGVRKGRKCKISPEVIAIY